ncbi:MAG: hypothetical protein ACOYLH_09840, partial [Flavobacteriales bacterium]
QHFVKPDIFVSMKKWFFSLSLLALVGCEGDQTLRYKIGGLTAIPLETSLAYPVELEGHSCQAATFGLRLDLHSYETYRKGRYFDYYESYAQCENPIKYLRITSAVGYNAAHPAGTLLNNCFYYFPGDYSMVVGPLSGSEPPNITARYMQDYETQNFPLYMDLLLLELPDGTIDMAFDVEIEFADGTTYESTTPVITLIP